MLQWHQLPSSKEVRCHNPWKTRGWQLWLHSRCYWGVLFEFLMLSTLSVRHLRKTICSPQKNLDSLPYVFVPHTLSLFPVACHCSPWGVGIPHAGCSSLNTAPNDMKLLSLERGRSDLQDYVIIIWIGSILTCVYSKWPIFRVSHNTTF